MAADLADLAKHAADGEASYERLMSLMLRHEFYGGEPCPDFAIEPTGPTQALMSTLGLIARPRRGGIDIIYHTSRCAGIVRFLHHERSLRREARTTHAGDKETSYKGSWTRLTFTLSLKNDLFANFTAIPLPMPHKMGVGEYALYLSNCYVKLVDVKQPAGQPMQLNSVWMDHWRRLPPVIFSPEHLHIPTPRDAVEFALYSTSGRALLRADPDYLPPDYVPGDQPPALPARVRLKPGSDVNVSMANETPGLFSHDIKVKNHVAAGTCRTEFFYSGTRTAPLLFADLFLANPEIPSDKPNVVSGYYPIDLPEQLPNNITSAAANAEAQRRIKPLDYEFCFEARKTTWIYYIVLPSGEAAVAGLAIEPKDALEFHPPEQVKLPTGAWAHRFVARTAIPLQRRSNIALRLRAGGGPGNGSARILLERLPTPSAERITARPPGPLTDASAASEVFVYL